MFLNVVLCCFKHDEVLNHAALACGGFNLAYRGAATAFFKDTA
jgi:hypothetical protein